MHVWMQMSPNVQSTASTTKLYLKLQATTPIKKKKKSQDLSRIRTTGIYAIEELRRAS